MLLNLQLSFINSIFDQISGVLIHQQQYSQGYQLYSQDKNTLNDQGDQSLPTHYKSDGHKS